jgi:hypothetical protein
MSVKVLAYVENMGDGSTAIAWVRDVDQEAFETYAETTDYFSDGDGICPKETLEFETYRQAEDVGIEFYEFDEVEEDDE